MKVVFLSDHCSSGGAAQATCRIVDSLAAVDQAGHQERIVFFPEGGDAPCPVHALWYEESALKRQLQRLPRKWLPRLFPRPHTPGFAAKRLRQKLQSLQPDLINIHNLHAATPWGWGPQLLDECLQCAPVVWTLHDMWSFTGRCAYSYDCRKFITGCDASCPTPHEDPPLAPEKIRHAWQQRRTLYARGRPDLAIVTPSHWLAQRAREGLFGQQRIEVIPYGFTSPGSAFIPHPRAEARRQLGMEPAGPVFLLAAFDLTERRKGADLLPMLWRHFPHRPLTILTMGRGSITIEDPRIVVRPLGWLKDDSQKALAYSAADALLHPAPVDNFPNVILEAFACGTPAIGMPIGGLPEMIRPGLSGWLAEAPTAAALGQAIARALEDLSLGKDLRASCRTLSEQEFSLHLQGKRYHELFRELQRR